MTGSKCTCSCNNIKTVSIFTGKQVAVFISNDCNTMFDFYKYHLWILVRDQDISWWVFMCVCEFDQYLQMNWRNLVLKNRESAGYSCMLNDNDFEVGE